MTLLNDSRTLLETLVVGLIVLLLIVSPWPFAGYLYQHQFFIWIVAVACTLLTCLSVINNPQVDLHKVPAVIWPSLILVALAAVQMLPITAALTNWDHAVMAEWLPAMSAREAWSIDPALTRLQLMRFICALGILWSAAYHFEDAGHRRVLWWGVAINGAVLSVFGIVQKIYWNGKLFWTVELGYGGQPFASFVNRNHAAGYLNMALACGLALWWWSQARSSVESNRDQPSSSTLASIGPATLVLVNLIGVFATLSRGGILAACVACAGVAMVANRDMRARFVVLFAGVMVLLTIALAATKTADLLQDRVETLESELQVDTSGRLQHWSDTFPAVLDSPLGTGLGTYRLANRPYQAHPTAGEFHNADNLYLELLVELGWPGLACVLLALLTLGWRLRGLWKRNTVYTTSLMALGLFLLLSQGLQAGTDFGPLMTANMLCLAALVGCVFVAVDDTENHEISGHGSSKRIHVALGVLLLLPAVPALILFDHAAQSETFIRGLPDTSYTVPMSAIDSRIAAGNRLLKQFPDHAPLHAALGRLAVLGYRRSTFEKLLLEVPDASEPQQKQIWEATSLSVLFEASRDPDVRTQLREMSFVDSYLLPAQRHFSQLKRLSPASPESYATLAALGPLLDDAPLETAAADWRHECALLPDASERLFAAGVMLQLCGDMAARDGAWQQSLRANNEKPRLLLQRIRLHASEADLHTWLPPRADIVLAFAETTKDEELRQHAAKNALELLSADDQLPEADRKFSRGKAYSLLGNFEQALSLIRSACQQRPDEVAWKLELAAVLEGSGDLPAALAEYQSILKTHPEQGSARTRIQRLEQALKVRPSGE